MIRVGLVGFGLAGRVFHAPLVSSVEGLELAAVVERSTDKAAARYPGITTYRTVDELLADASIKLVVVATPNATHYPIAMTALQAAKHVVVDKPAGMNAAEIAELMDLAGGLGLQLIPFHNRRWDGDFKTVRKIVDEHTLGMLAHVQSTFDRWRPGSSRSAWKEEPEQGGLLLDLGTHLADQTLQLFGLPDTVSAEIRHERSGDGAPDAFTVRLHYFTGLNVELSANTLSALARPRFHLRGTRGNYWKWGLDPQEDALGKITRIDDAEWGKDPAEKWGTLATDEGDGLSTRAFETLPGDYRAFYAGVRDAILGAAPAPVTARDAWQVAHLLELAEASAKSGRTIECDWSQGPA